MIAVLSAAASNLPALGGEKTSRPIDFNREIRPILTHACFTCHGPDANKRKGVSKPLRLDTQEGALADLGGYSAIVKGKPEESELIERIGSKDPDVVMPPAGVGKRLSEKEIDLLADWIRQGAVYAKHWAYVKPVAPVLPEVKNTGWPKNPIDFPILARLEREGLAPSPEADRSVLIRRLSLDLTGLPPTLEETERFRNDSAPDAYESLVDRLLSKPAYGEHWAREWLDLARYADSSGYADDPPRTVWAYRDEVIRSFNQNKPFDRFTLEQLAGDLLPNPTDEQLIATAFHRNTMTNNEGGTSDEEFRNVAVVDRVNTTMAVWMGTTIACAQCHDHKYDPISQREYFQMFAFFNNTEDADRGDESPLLALESAEQKKRKAEWRSELGRLEEILRTPTAESSAGQARWEKSFAESGLWRVLAPSSLKSRGEGALTVLADRSVLVESTRDADVYRAEFAWRGGAPRAIRLEALADDSLPGKGPGRAPNGNFVVSRVAARWVSPAGSNPSGRYVRVELPGKAKILSLAEAQVFSGGENVAPGGKATQKSTAFGGSADRAIDGDTDGRFFEAKSTTHTEASDDPWWELDLKISRPIDRIVLWNRTDSNLQNRLRDFRIVVLDESRREIWSQKISAQPDPSVSIAPPSLRALKFVAAYADYSQPGFDAGNAIDNQDVSKRGWAVGGKTGESHALTLVVDRPSEIPNGSTLSLTIEQLYPQGRHTLGRFRISTTEDDRAVEAAKTPGRIAEIVRIAPAARSDEQARELSRYYLAEVAPEKKEARERAAVLRKRLADLKPETTVPIMRELRGEKRRKTRIQHRGNFLDLGDEVAPGVPAAFPPLPENAPKDRAALARWLTDENNPLTARVLANRYWERLFGTGLVATSEDFGMRCEPPSHPELLDFLATELSRTHWDLKRFLKLLVTSAAYRQTSRATPELLARDPENRLIARGPRFRLSAETVRDQALFAAGLLSPKMFGPPVKPPQPSTGLNAAFGGGIDWQTSRGEDRYRRGIYTTWRRSNPYPSMTVFDAPNREVCTLRRSRTNTPLQALVTLNDPVYVEAAQGLARRMIQGEKTAEGRARLGFRLCLIREPRPEELDRLVRLQRTARASFATDPAKAALMAGRSSSDLPQEVEVADLAAWTVVGNVLLNLDETLMKP